MKLAALLVLTVGALALPASALATSQDGAVSPWSSQPTGTATVISPVNVASDKLMLNAYAAYLGAVVKGLPAAQTMTTGYIATISNDCKSALQPLMQPNEQVNTAVQQTLTALGEEMGDDLSINFDASAIEPFTKLSTTAAHLHWSRLSMGVTIVRRYLNTEAIALEMGSSYLCQDALLAASAPQTVPTGTKVLIKGYARASNAATLALQNLLKLMQTYETANERAVVTRISTLAGEIAKQTKSDLLQNASSLTSTLET